MFFISSFKIEKYLSRIPYQSSNITGLNILDVTASSDAVSSLISIKSQSKFPLVNPNFFLGNENIKTNSYIFS